MMGVLGDRRIEPALMVCNRQFPKGRL